MFVCVCVSISYDFDVHKNINDMILQRKLNNFLFLKKNKHRKIKYPNQT